MGVSGDFRPVSTVDAAAAALRDAIGTGQFTPGERIKEIPVAQSLGLSRGPVREALRLLAEESLVTITLNVGATVADVTVQDLMELYAQRLSLGSLALRTLTGNEVLAAAEHHLAQLLAAAKRKDVAAAVAADLELQDALVRCSSLQRTVRLFERTTTQLRVYAGMLAIDYKPRLRAMHQEDARLLELLRAGDTQSSQALWRAKLEGWLEVFIAHVGDAFDEPLWRQTYVGEVTSD